jgi:SulP family sulfate permease
VIAAQEVPSALGVDKPAADNSAAAAAVAVGRFAQHPHWASVGLLALTVALMVGLPRIHRSLPASLVAIMAVTLVAGAGRVDVDRLGSLPRGLPMPTIPSIPDFTALIDPALVVAFLAALESLLSAQVADGTSDGPRYDPNRELFE